MNNSKWCLPVIFHVGYEVKYFPPLDGGPMFSRRSEIGCNAPPIPIISRIVDLTFSWPTVAHSCLGVLFFIFIFKLRFSLALLPRALCWLSRYLSVTCICRLGLGCLARLLVVALTVSSFTAHAPIVRFFFALDSPLESGVMDGQMAFQ